MIRRSPPPGGSPRFCGIAERSQRVSSRAQVQRLAVASADCCPSAGIAEYGSLAHSAAPYRRPSRPIQTRPFPVGEDRRAVTSVRAAEVEEAVGAQVRRLLHTPEIMARTWAAAKNELQIPERDVIQTATDFAPMWDELF